MKKKLMKFFYFFRRGYAPDLIRALPPPAPPLTDSPASEIPLLKFSQATPLPPPSISWDSWRGSDVNEVCNQPSTTFQLKIMVDLTPQKSG